MSEQTTTTGASRRDPTTVKSVCGKRFASPHFWMFIGLAMCAFGMVAMAYSIIRMHRENVAASAVRVVEKAAQVVRTPAPKRVLKYIDASKCKKNQYHMKGRTLTIDPSCTTITYSDEPQAQ